MKLYFVTGACSLSPHIVLQELGLPYELARVDFKTKRTSDDQDFLAVNPKGAVAALQLDDGEVVTEGPAIVQYLADLKPEAKLAPANGTLARVRLQEWLNFISSELHAGVGPLFNPAVPEAAKEIAKAKVFKKLDVVEKTLAKQDYLLDLAGWPSTAAFVKRIGARPSVAAARAAEDKIPKFE